MLSQTFLAVARCGAKLCTRRNSSNRVVHVTCRYGSGISLLPKVSAKNRFILSTILPLQVAVTSLNRSFSDQVSASLFWVRWLVRIPSNCFSNSSLFVVSDPWFHDGNTTLALSSISCSTAIIIFVFLYIAKASTAWWKCFGSAGNWATETSEAKAFQRVTNVRSFLRCSTYSRTWAHSSFPLGLAPSSLIFWSFFFKSPLIIRLAIPKALLPTVRFRNPSTSSSSRSISLGVSTGFSRNRLLSATVEFSSLANSSNIWNMSCECPIFSFIRSVRCQLCSDCPSSLFRFLR